MAYRKITINNEEWEWNCGMEFVDIRKVDKSIKHIVSIAELTNNYSTKYTIPVKPSHIMKYIIEVINWYTDGYI